MHLAAVESFPPRSSGRWDCILTLKYPLSLNTDVVVQKYKMIVAVKAGEMIDKSKNQLDRTGVEGGH